MSASKPVNVLNAPPPSGPIVGLVKVRTVVDHASRPFSLSLVLKLTLHPKTSPRFRLTSSSCLIAQICVPQMTTKPEHVSTVASLLAEDAAFGKSSEPGQVHFHCARRSMKHEGYTDDVEVFWVWDEYVDGAALELYVFLLYMFSFIH